MPATPARRTALALRHVPFEDLGTLEPVLRSRGYDVEYSDVGLTDISPGPATAADLLVVLGGPIGVRDEDRYPALHATKEVVRQRLRTGRATLGICLGAQIIAEALGADVRSTGAVEIGYAPLELTEAGFASPLRPLHGASVLHWHGDEFTIPAGARHLARTPGFPFQAFRTDAALALQFHLEADHRAIESWLIGHAHELRHHGVDPRVIREQALLHGPRLESIAAEVIGLWLDEVEGTEPHVADTDADV